MGKNASLPRTYLIPFLIVPLLEDDRLRLEGLDRFLPLVQQLYVDLIFTATIPSWGVPNKTNTSIDQVSATGFNNEASFIHLCSVADQKTVVVTHSYFAMSCLLHLFSSTVTSAYGDLHLTSNNSITFFYVFSPIRYFDVWLEVIHKRWVVTF